MRVNNRGNKTPRPMRVTLDYIKHPKGSVLMEMGDTKVLCNVSIEEKVPPFLKGSGQGWLTAEYAMLPASTHSRKTREASKGKLEGRTMEIQRLIGRSLRAAVNLKRLGERTIWIDCDVLQADGGTRTAAITGGYVALELAIRRLINEGVLTENPLVAQVAAVSVGIHAGEICVDLDYPEDSNAQVDMNIVMNSNHQIIEIQGTGEERAFTKQELDLLYSAAEEAIEGLFAVQRQYLDAYLHPKTDGKVTL